jgi:nucleoid DNA-binding protein
MIYSDLVREVAKASGVRQDDVKKVIDASFSVIANALLKDGEVVFGKLGKFIKRHMDSRQGRNVRTGEVITIEARDVPAFKPSEPLKRVISGEVKLPRDDD